MRTSVKSTICRLRRIIPERHTLWDRFYETSDTVVKIKVISLLMRVGSLPGVNLHAIVEDLIQLLNTDDENRKIGKIFYFVYFISDDVLL